MAWAGHAMVSITIDNYLHLLPIGPKALATWGHLQRAPLTGIDKQPDGKPTRPPNPGS